MKSIKGTITEYPIQQKKQQKKQPNQKDTVEFRCVRGMWKTIRLINKIQDSQDDHM